MHDCRLAMTGAQVSAFHDQALTFDFNQKCSIKQASAILAVETSTMLAMMLTSTIRRIPQ